MIDIETLGKTPDAVITSIAAGRFDIETGALEDIFYQCIDWQNQPGRIIDATTVQWWFRQDEDARLTLSASVGIQLGIALELLRKFIEKTGLGKEEIIWVNGPEFDISILTNAYQNDPLNKQVNNGHTPWEFWNTRDCRTMRAVTKGIVDKNDFNRGQEHDALDDVKFQIQYVSAMWQALRAEK